MKSYGAVRQTTDDSTIWRMRFACWITEATNTNSVYAMLIAFPWQQWLPEGCLIIRYTCIAYFVIISVNIKQYILGLQPYLPIFSSCECWSPDLG